MGKLAIYKYLSFMMLVFTILVTVFIIMGLFGGNSNPATGTAMALTVFALPALIVIDIVLLLFWLIRRRWIWAIIPGVTLLCCIPYIGTIYQTGLFSDNDTSKSGVNIATYNVCRFGMEMNGYKSGDILSMMKRKDIGILCMQEYQETSGEKKNSETYKKYFTDMAKGLDDMVIFSRYPILESKTIMFENSGNSGMWADIDVNGRVFRVFNVHLQTTGINGALHRANKQASQGKAYERSKLFRAMYGNYTMGMDKRALQADLVASEIKQSPHPVILCGDFNDIPYSYVYKTMKGDLVDGFKECGKGLMYTMNSGKKWVRIDYIFHSEGLKGSNYYKENTSYSDHFPVFMRINL